jgi:hypothetical protein
MLNQSSVGYLAEIMNQASNAVTTENLKGKPNPSTLEIILATFNKQKSKDFAIISPEMEKEVFIQLVDRSYREIALYSPNTILKYGDKNGLNPKCIRKIRNSILFDTLKISAALKKNGIKFFNHKDMVTDIMEDLRPTSASISDLWNQLDLQLKSLMPQYIGLREEYLKSKFIPDANSTLRLTYGHIRAFSPNDGEVHTPYTTLDGVFARPIQIQIIDYRKTYKTI